LANHSEGILAPRVAIMQPYLFPHMPYFQLIHSVDTFVFLDDVQWISRGWINRNRILVDGRAFTFTVPVAKHPRSARICSVELAPGEAWHNLMSRRLGHAYARAPYLAQVRELVARVAHSSDETAAGLAIGSIQQVCEYLGLRKQFLRSSRCSPESAELRAGQRLITVARELRCGHFINSEGGRGLYTTEMFAAAGLTLSFLSSEIVTYPQSGHEFVGGLSILDALVWNPPDTVREWLGRYALV